MIYEIITGSAKDVANMTTSLMNTVHDCRLLSLTATISNSNNQITYAQPVMYGYSKDDVIVLEKVEDYKALEGRNYWLGESIERVIRHADMDEDAFLFTPDNDPTFVDAEDRETFYAIIKEN